MTFSSEEIHKNDKTVQSVREEDEKKIEELEEQLGDIIKEHIDISNVYKEQIKNKKVKELEKDIMGNNIIFNLMNVFLDQIIKPSNDKEQILYRTKIFLEFTKTELERAENELAQLQTGSSSSKKRKEKKIARKTRKTK
jgi:hypothetical protein